MKKDNTYRFNIQFRAVTDEQIQVGEFLSSLGRAKGSCIIEAIRQYMIANPEIVRAAFALGEAFISSDAPSQEAALTSPPTAVEGSTCSFHSEVPASSEDEGLEVMIKNLELFK